MINTPRMTQLTDAAPPPVQQQYCPYIRSSRRRFRGDRAEIPRYCDGDHVVDASTGRKPTNSDLRKFPEIPMGNVTHSPYEIFVPAREDPYSLAFYRSAAAPGDVPGHHAGTSDGRPRCCLRFQAELDGLDGAAA